MNKKINTIMYILFIVTIGVLVYLLINKNDNQLNITSNGNEYSSQIEELNKTIESKNKEINDLSTKVNDFQSNVDSLKNEKIEKEKELDTLTETYNKLKSSKSKSSNTNSKEITNLKNEIDSKKKELENITNSINEKENTIISLENEINTLKETYVVIYVSDSGIVAKYNIKKGGSVTDIPNVPNKTGYNGTWNRNGENITDNTVIVATYTPKTYNISYNYDFNNVYYLINAKVNINNRDFDINYRDKKYVFEYLDEYDAVIVSLEEEKVIVDGKTYKLNLDWNYYADENGNFIDNFDYIGNDVFCYIGEKSFIYNRDTHKYRITNAYSIRTDNIFIVDGVKYRIGGEDFKVYYDNKSVNLTDMTFYNWQYLTMTINNNKVTNNTDSNVTTIVDGKFTYGGTNYETAPGIVALINKRGDGSTSLKNGVVLPTKYTYGDKYITLPNASKSFNDITSPNAHVGAWIAPFDVIDDKYVLYENTYGDITIYLNWSPWS